MESVTHKNKVEALKHLALPLVFQESLLPRSQGETILRRQYGEVDITLSGGVRKGQRLLLPSGLIARRLLYWAITTARYNGSPEIIISGSKEFLNQLNLGVSARRKQDLKKQLIRLIGTTITIEKFNAPGHELTIPNLRMFDSFDLMNFNGDQLQLFESKVVFTPEFWQAINSLPHQPINKDVLFALSSPMAMDLYLWIQRRAFTVKGSKMLKWSVLYKQFAMPRETKSNFRKTMLNAVEAVNPVLHSWGENPIVYGDEGLIIRNAPEQFVIDTNHVGWS
jgi:hypothetical protein